MYTATTHYITNSIRFVDICGNISSGRYIYDSIPNCKVEILLEIIQIECFGSNIHITTIPSTITLTIQYVLGTVDLYNVNTLINCYLTCN